MSIPKSRYSAEILGECLRAPGSVLCATDMPLYERLTVVASLGISQAAADAARKVRKRNGNGQAVQPSLPGATVVSALGLFGETPTTKKKTDESLPANPAEWLASLGGGLEEMEEEEQE